MNLNCHNCRRQTVSQAQCALQTNELLYNITLWNRADCSIVVMICSAQYVLITHVQTVTSHLRADYGEISLARRLMWSGKKCCRGSLARFNDSGWFLNVCRLKGSVSFLFKAWTNQYSSHYEWIKWLKCNVKGDTCSEIYHPTLQFPSDLQRCSIIGWFYCSGSFSHSNNKQILIKKINSPPVHYLAVDHLNQDWVITFE